MKQDPSFPHLRAVLSLLAVLAVFVTAVNVFLLKEHNSLMVQSIREHTTRELVFITIAAREAILKHDYASVEQFLKHWGMENNDIAALRATTPSGFVLVDYKRAGTPSNPFHISRAVRYGGAELLNIDLTTDLKSVAKASQRLIVKNILLSVAFAAVMALVIWFAFKRTALVPMEHMVREINLINEGLEQRVTERTSELTKTNEELEREISERIKVETRLETSENFLRSILDTEPECVKVLDNDGRLVSMNAAGLKMIEADSAEQVIGKDILDLVSPDSKDDFSRLHKNVCEGKSGSLEFEVVTLKGNRRLLESHAVPFQSNTDKRPMVLSITRDITERKKLEEQLRHAQKMEAVGTLTSGLAHEFNNIMTTIIGYGEFLQTDLNRDDPRRHYADMVMASAERAAKLTHGLLAYTRKQITHIRATSLNQILSTLNEFLDSQTPEAVKLKISMLETDLNILADKVQIEQVLMNIASNALDAMPGGGSLSIEARQVRFDTDTVIEQAMVAPGTYVLINVSDTGQGIDEEHREKIFEPFFTTKDVGQGTGLGLAMAFGIVEKHMGYLTVSSTVGQGATFGIYLPVAETGESARIKPAPEEEKPLRGSETVLLAEDDPSVRFVIRQVLDKNGYTVVEAKDGVEAVKVFSERKEDIDLLLFDISMPNMSGLEALEAISKSTPDVKALFMSGYIFDENNLRDFTGAGVRLLNKPVHPIQLLRAIREVLS